MLEAETVRLRMSAGDLQVFGMRHRSCLREGEGVGKAVNG